MLAQQLTILVTGACGQMGKYVVGGVVEEADMKLVGAVDPAGRGQTLSEIVPGGPEDIVCSGHLAAALEESQPQIMIDFTTPDVVMDNIQAALNAGVACVVGTTGFSPVDLQVVQRLC
ncbi:MAG: 4-hydroxy-tetrahydrodipicolinate reductase, partial [Planctomycetes bacterium]|nr:4-hydroxy-tetrahydrodipicolinate reductase [Planctomycetota bacterium]